jgi:hypothetical protein
VRCQLFEGEVEDVVGMGENAVIAQEPTQSAGAVSRDVEGLDERCSADLTGGEDS